MKNEYWFGILALLLAAASAVAAFDKFRNFSKRTPVEVAVDDEMGNSPWAAVFGTAVSCLFAAACFGILPV